MLDDGAIARIVLEGSDAEVADAVSGLRGDEARARDLLALLARHRRPEVRGWASWAARVVLGLGGAPIIQTLVRDRDDDVRNIALQDLKALDPGLLRPELPRIRRSLRTGPDPVFGIWMVAELGDEEALIDLDRVAEDFSRAPYIRNAARIAALALRKDTVTIARAVLGHDHDSMHWLVQAALLVPDAIVVDALTTCAREAPDDSCRHYCREAVHMVQESDAV